MSQVQDRNVENPYRFGVLIGNWVEERYATELSQKPKAHIPLLTTTQAVHSKRSTAHYSEPSPLIGDDVFIPNQVSQRGVDRHIFFGHGPDQQDFEQRDFRTTYELTTANKIQAHKTIESHFIPPPPVPRPQSIAANTGKEMLKPKAYNEFTKSCDAGFNKIGLRR
ncbi:unnamed protein product [Blepharisma stoltei]|uniref:Uncharacterized protein n=1 Tax=Blepharisma stoltei TaxID=1481888 RepID=A0AAU9KL17_9CILI|nr:unnamed protein product [Blepharisma stoltei]